MSTQGLIARLALIPFGLAVAIIGLEVVLQLASLLVTSGTEPDQGVGAEQTRSRILCLGDSNTYGLWLDDRDREAYPAQLEALWNATQPTSVEVINLGYPGTNSSRILHHLPEMLELVAPERVVLMVGVNDAWTIPVDTTGSRVRRFLEQYSRLYKTVYLMLHRVEAGRLAVETHSEGSLEEGQSNRGRAAVGGRTFDMSWEWSKAESRGRRDLLEENLGRIIELTRASGAEITLMTYPSNYLLYIPANKVLRKVAEETGTPLVDLRVAFDPLCDEEDCPEWFYGDHHPRANGYRVVAEALMESLVNGEGVASGQ